MKPHPDNACSGKYDDWLEVNLLSECNGSCSWCVENGGYHPSERASWQRIVEVAIGTGKSNVILLGGEPTLHPEIKDIVRGLQMAGRNVYLTTNGSMLSGQFVIDNIVGVRGVNISVHDDDLARNEDVTGISLGRLVLRGAVDALHQVGASVRLNCNCIRGHVDSRDAVSSYIHFAKWLGADSVRFAELKGDGGDFVDLVDMFGETYGLSSDPFSCGCSVDVVMDGMPVNLRIMCGLQTKHREPPTNPEQVLHGVLYYDGNVYNGWQREVIEMDAQAEKALDDVLDRLKNGLLTREDAKKAILKVVEHPTSVAKALPVSGGGCVY